MLERNETNQILKLCFLLPIMTKEFTGSESHQYGNT